MEATQVEGKKGACLHQFALDPNNCGQCRCPYGLGGSFGAERVKIGVQKSLQNRCDDCASQNLSVISLSGPSCAHVEASTSALCGGELNAQAFWQHLTYKGRGSRCIWRIRANNARIRLILDRADYTCEVYNAQANVVWSFCLLVRSLAQLPSPVGRQATFAKHCKVS